MIERHKKILRTIIEGLRTRLVGDGAEQRGDLDRELERLGVAPDGKVIPLDALPNPTHAERRARFAAEASINAAAEGVREPKSSQQRVLARTEVIERAAYTWINRLLALRTMEARGLIDETLRANPDYEGLSEALYVLRAEQPTRAGGADGGWWAVLEDACTAQAANVPGLFDLRDPAAALRPSTPALVSCITLIGNAPSGQTLIESDQTFADPDAIGWAYQFYQEAAKAQIDAKVKAGGKAATRAEIAAKTQLFTEPYMVQWLLQNSLGRCYHEAYPDSALPQKWAYYIRRTSNDQQGTSGQGTDSLVVGDWSLANLTLIDPCCGSGHFLREAFDMFVDMYRERHDEWSATQIADRIFEQHVHGIDLDPRAAQLAALTLFLRARELVRDEHRACRLPGSGNYSPPAMNIVATPTGLNTGALQRHLRRHPGDRVMRPLLEGVFEALEQADILGSLLRPGEQIAKAIQELQRPHTIQMDFDVDDAKLRQTITMLANTDPVQLKRTLLDRVATSFRAENEQGNDVSEALFGREAAGGVRLLQLLDRTYAVVVTNPPYLGSGSMEKPLKDYVEKHYKPGKRDLYAAFILRCLALARPSGRVAMITQQSWMFLRSYADLRALPEEKLVDARRKHEYTGLLRETTIESLAHLGPNGFQEISGEVVQNAMFVMRDAMPQIDHRMVAFRLVGLKSGSEKARVLREAVVQLADTKPSIENLNLHS